MKTKIGILLLFIGLAFAADCSSMGWGSTLSCFTSSGTSGGGEVILLLAILWAVMWLAAAYLFSQKRLIYAYGLYIFGLISLMSALTIGMDFLTNAMPNSVGVISVLLLGTTWILVLSLVGFVLYIFFAIMFKMAEFAGVHVKQWWFTGRFDDKERPPQMRKMM